MLKFAKFLTLVGLAMLPIAVAAFAYLTPDPLVPLAIGFLVIVLVAFCYWVFEDLDERGEGAIFCVVTVIGAIVVGTGQLVRFVAKACQWAVRSEPPSNVCDSALDPGQSTSTSTTSTGLAGSVLPAERPAWLRIVDLAEERKQVAEQLGLSVAGLVAEAVLMAEDGDPFEASQRIREIDELINQARSNPGRAMPIDEVRTLMSSVHERLAAVERTLAVSRSAPGARVVAH